jgi:hypothetical protein
MCCEQFQWHVEEMGKRGLSIVLKSRGDFTFFCLQSRGCDYEHAKLLEGKNLGIDRQINVATQIAIKYCPFCGTKLEDWLFHNRTEAQKLINRSEQFIL